MGAILMLCCLLVLLLVDNQPQWWSWPSMPICNVNAQVTTLTSSIQSKGYNGARSWRRLVDAYVILIHSSPPLTIAADHIEC
jgi:hypothetical protein